MIVWTASVGNATGTARHYVAVRNLSGNLEASSIQGTVSLDIDVCDEGVFLLHRDASGDCIADTWHLSVEEAKQQARLEFSVEENDWIEIKR